MKILIQRRYTQGVTPEMEYREIECRGSGTMKDPAIIEPLITLPLGFQLEKSDLHIIIQNCYLNTLELSYCQNVRIENCNVWKILITHCLEVVINKSTLRRKITLWYSNDSKIEDCSIRKLRIVVSNSWIIKNCSIKKIRCDKRSSNLFEANKLPE